jgi:prevent-host-death family protein
MSTIVNIHEAKTHLSRLLEQAIAGEEVIFAKAGKPCARLVPIAAQKPVRKPGRLKGKVDHDFFEPLSPSELALWEGR